MENSMSNNINNGVKNSVNANKDVGLMIKDSLNMFDSSNEEVIKDADLCNISPLNEDIMLKCFYQIRIALGKIHPKEALISKEDVQLPEEVIVKDNDKVLMCVVGLLGNLVEHVIHHMHFDLELIKIKDVVYHLDFHANLMKDDTCDKGYISYIFSIIVVTKSPTQKKDELIVLHYYEESS